MPEHLLMTPGPTAVPPDVRAAMARPLTNPDVEPAFREFYRSVLDDLAWLYGTDDDVLVLGGEGMLGLDAAVASLVGPGDEVLCLANGVFGAGFADLVETHGGEAVVHEVPPDEGFDADAVAAVVADSDVEVATMVHCETPTGVLNDFDDVLAVLDDAGVCTVVDAVSSLGGTPVPVDRVDVCLGASQKCLSSPPGLSTLSVSDAAWDRVDATPQDGFYASLHPWRDVDLAGSGSLLLPYTHLVSNLEALSASLDRLRSEGLEAAHDRHEAAAALCRRRGRDLGLELVGDPAAASPTVTAFSLPGRAAAVQRRLAADHDVVVATSVGPYAADVLRVGHMGYNADREKVGRTMDALAAVLEG